MAEAPKSIEVDVNIKNLPEIQAFVIEAMAKAWEDGWEAGWDERSADSPGAGQKNPYSEDT